MSCMSRCTLELYIDSVHILAFKQIQDACNPLNMYSRTLLTNLNLIRSIVVGDIAEERYKSPNLDQ